MNLTEYAKSELDRLGKDKDGMQEMMNRDILGIIEKFGEGGVQYLIPMLVAEA